MVLILGACSSENPDTKTEDNNVSNPDKVINEGGIPDEMPAVKSSLKVEFSKGSGLYEDEFDLKLSCNNNAIIYYTTDGSNPITSATRKRYESPIRITDRKNDKNYVSAVDQFLYDAANVRVNKTKDGFTYNLPNTPSDEAVDKCTVIRAAAYDDQGYYSEVVTNTYFIGDMKEHIKGIEES